MVEGWADGVVGFLADNNLAWEQVRGVGLAIPGPYLSYGVLGETANMPESFNGWDFRTDYAAALATRAGRPVPVACAYHTPARFSSFRAYGLYD